MFVCHDREKVFLSAMPLDSRPCTWNVEDSHITTLDGAGLSFDGSTAIVSEKFDSFTIIPADFRKRALPNTFVGSYLLVYKNSSGLADTSNILNFAEVRLFDRNKAAVSIAASSLTTSSQAAGAVPANVIDGNTATFYQSSESSTTQDQWLHIPIPSSIDGISSISITNRGDACCSSRLVNTVVRLVFPNYFWEHRFTEFASLTYTLTPPLPALAPVWTDPGMVPHPPLFGNFFALTKNSTGLVNADNSFAIAEIQFFDVNGARWYHKTVNITSSTTKDPIANAFDNNMGTIYQSSTSSTQTNKGQYVRWDLPADFKGFSKIVLHQRTNCCWHRLQNVTMRMQLPGYFWSHTFKEDHLNLVYTIYPRPLGVPAAPEPQPTPVTTQPTQTTGTTSVTPTTTSAPIAAAQVEPSTTTTSTATASELPQPNKPLLSGNYILIQKNFSSPSNILKIGEVRAFKRIAASEVTFSSSAITVSSTDGPKSASLILDDRVANYWSSATGANDVLMTQWLRIDLGVESVQHLEILRAPGSSLVGVEVRVVQSGIWHSTIITRNRPLVDIFVLGAANDIHLIDTDTKTRYHMISRTLRRYPDHASWRKFGSKRIFQISDSAVARLPLGADMPTTSTLNQIVISNRADGNFRTMNIINIAELKLYKTDGTLHPLVATDITTSSTSTSSTSNLLIDNSISTFIQTKTSSIDSGELTRDQFIWINVPSGLSLSRIELVNRQDKCCGGRTASSVVSWVRDGVIMLDTEFRGHHSIINVFVPVNGQYQNGLLVKDASTNLMYWTENNQLRPVSEQVYRQSGMPSFYHVADWSFLSLPQGLPMTSLPTALPNFISFVKEAQSFYYDLHQVLEMSELSVFLSDGTKVAVTAADIQMSSIQDLGTEKNLIDASTSTFVQTRNKGTNDEETRSDQFIRVRLPAVSNPALSVSRVEIENTANPSRMVGVKMTVKLMSQYFETYITQEQPRYVIQLLSVATTPASSTLQTSRQYPTLMNADFPNAPSIFNSSHTHEQCAQKCDYTPGCVAYTTDDAAGFGCWLRFNPLGLPSAASNKRTFIASSTTPAALTNNAVQSAKIYRFIDNFSITASDTFTAMSISGCAAACNANPACIGYSYHKTGPTGCWMKTSISGSNNFDTSREGYLALTPIKLISNGAAESLGEILKFVNQYGTAMKINGEDQFVVQNGYDLDGIFFTFASKQYHDKRICRIGNQVVLTVPNATTLCNWLMTDITTTTPRTVSLKSDNPDDEVAVFLTSTGFGRSEFGLGTTSESYIPVIMPKFKKNRPYLPAIAFEFTGDTNLTVYHGPVTRCADLCDSYEDCKGYTIFANEMGCILKSVIGTQTSVASPNKTVIVNPYTSTINEVVPWQTAQSLIGGLPRTAFTGMGIHVHLVDSGVTSGYGELGYYRDFLMPVNGSDWADQVGHADAIAKILRYAQGIVPGASIHNTKIFDIDGRTSPRAFVQAMADIIQKATDNFNSPLATRPTVVSLSVLFPSDNMVNCITQLAYSKNIFIVAGAGNNNTDAAMYSPGQSGYALVVGAYGANKGYQVSNYGPAVDIFAASGKYPHPSKPNQAIEGTSLSTPQVSGILAKMLWERPEFQMLPPIYAYNAIRGTGIPFHVHSVPAGTTNRALHGKTQTASAFTYARANFNPSDYCGARTVGDVIREASNVATGNAISSPGNPSMVDESYVAQDYPNEF